ncbi:gp16 [Listeria phage P40]|uniref:tail protein n=1 Tax=Listeria phage P40 TaxID=560178 RepID=UPI00018198D6|nr:tail protein [Listeria phage P40]ACI00376.1 gp16 [Listeria phage P40]
MAKMGTIQNKKNRPVHVTIISRDPAIPKTWFETNDYEVAFDVITMPTSKFMTYTDLSKWNFGDLVVVKFVGESSPFYWGMVDSVTLPDLIDEQKELVTLPFEAICKNEIPATAMMGTSFELHYLQLMNKYVKNSSSKQFNQLLVYRSTNTPHRYRPSEKVTSVNMLDYFINGFKKYRVVMNKDEYNADTRMFKVTLNVPSGNIKIKDNVRDFSNWAFTSTVGTVQANMAYIYNANLNNQNTETAVQANYFYMQTDGQIVLGAGADLTKVDLPTQSVSLFRAEPPTPALTPAQQAQEDLELASGALSASMYSHEFQVDLDMNSHILRFEDIKVGQTATITFQGKVYNSVYTGYNIQSNSSVYRLTFGHNRNKLTTRLREKLE